MGEAKRRALGAVPVTVAHRRMAARIDARIRQLDALGMQDELRAANVPEGSRTMLMRIFEPMALRIEHIHRQVVAEVPLVAPKLLVEACSCAATGSLCSLSHYLCRND